ncbi:MAG: STAS domain-containing protein [Spirochaetes bacterium]|nr:STAS domain-containing protein [Spirochaetota bacterium]MBX3721764.1 STAS domain-containing protein [Turneriella sp.]
MLQELEHITLETRYKDAGAMVGLQGVLSLSTSLGVKEKLTAMLNEGIRSLTVDLLHIKHIDSVGLATLIIISRLCSDQGVRFEIARPAEPVERLLRSTGLRKHLLFAG